MINVIGIYTGVEITGMEFTWRGIYRDDFNWGKTCRVDIYQGGKYLKSNLGSLLFLQYLIDLSRSSEVLNFVYSADDKTIFLSLPWSDALVVILNEELSKVSGWLRAKRLMLFALITWLFNIEHDCEGFNSKLLK